MTGMADWQTNNEAYLSAALQWLRGRLEALSQPPAKLTPPDKQKSGGWRLARFKPAASDTTAASDENSAVEIQMANLAAAMQDAEKVDPPPALCILAQRLGLSRFEQHVLLLCAAMELDTRTASLCARAQNDSGKPYPTFALAIAALDDAAWDALSPERPLRYWRLIEINQPGAQPLTTSALRADERIVNFIKGLNTLDERVTSLVTPMPPQSIQLPSSEQTVRQSILHSLQISSGRLTEPVVQLVGTDTASKKTIASQVAAALKLNLYSLAAENIPTHPAELETLARLWQRETFLLPIALYLQAQEIEFSSTQNALPLLQRFLARNTGLCFVDSREVLSGIAETTQVFDVANPTPIEQQSLWTQTLGAMAGENPAQLAGQFNLDALSIERIANMALKEASENKLNKSNHVWELCLLNARPKLESLAQRLDCKATWDDIVLPTEATTLLHQIADQVRLRTQVYDDWGFRDKMNRGFGITVLVCGESGVGKTMAAEVIANDLRLDLYRIDLSSVVSKYIGETEKNLRRLFDAAEGGGAILFFDEADALFGKRSEVKDSHDRYANIEINYLLQRMEAYGGLAILATNMKSALDPAFTRRLRFIINFPFPSAAERKLMWQKVLPPHIPKGELDYDRLAKLNLTGGAIHNIGLNAAFLAAARQPSLITLPLILEAARTEFRKMDKPINEAEFRIMEAVGVKT